MEEPQQAEPPVPTQPPKVKSAARFPLIVKFMLALMSKIVFLFNVVLVLGQLILLALILPKYLPFMPSPMDEMAFEHGAAYWLSPASMAAGYTPTTPLTGCDELVSTFAQHGSAFNIPRVEPTEIQLELAAAYNLAGALLDILASMNDMTDQPEHAAFINQAKNDLKDAASHHLHLHRLLYALTTELERHQHQASDHCKTLLAYEDEELRCTVAIH